MSSQRNSPNPNEEDEGQWSDNEGQNPSNSGYIVFVIMFLIPIPQPTRLGQPVTDQRTTDPDDLTNPQIDDLIQRPPESLETTILATCWHTIIFYLLIYSYAPLLILVLIVHWIIAYNNQSTVPLPEPLPQHTHLPFHHDFHLYRDATAEGRTAVENFVPFGVQTTLINNNQGQINPIIQNETILPTTTDRNEELNFDNNVQRQDPTPPIPEIRLVPVENNPQTVTNPLRNEAVEVENIAPPNDGGAQALLLTTRPTSSIISQPKTSPSSNGASHEKSTR